MGVALMTDKIYGKEHQLSEIFSSKFRFLIPEYQRPYSWTEEEAGTLFDDLYDFYESQPSENYFLGSLVLIKEEGKPDAEVIDGQQRLTTLTILFAVLANRFKNDSKKFGLLSKYVVEPGDYYQNLDEKPRLELRKKDNDFFLKYIQKFKVDECIGLRPEQQDTEAKAHIIKNTKLLKARVDDRFTNDNEIDKFLKFLILNCYLVEVSTLKKSTAFRVFSIMNNRGMNLMVTDIIKAEVIGQITDTERLRYSEKWENMEIMLTRNGFSDLFGHIRMIKMRCKAQKSLFEEYDKSIIPDLNSAKAINFIDNILEPYSDAYYVIKRCAYTCDDTKVTNEINDILEWLNRIDNSDWVPVALFYYNTYKEFCDKVLTFLKKLERLAVFMRISSYDVNKRIARYAQVLNDIDPNEPNDYNSIELTDEEKVNFVNLLDSDVYLMTSSKRNYLILRLDSFVSGGGAKYDSKVLTIEHVLPQTVTSGSQWEKNWTDKEREQWLHKISNLVPLSRRQNSSAQNFEFDEKKEKYFKGKTGTAPYPLTTQVINEKEWTPKVVANRQKNLIQTFKTEWQL